MKYPLTGTYKAGWNLSEEFVNLYGGLGGEFFKAGTSVVSISNEKGVAALEMMKKLSGYMHPDYLTIDTDMAAPLMLQGQAAMANLWGSRSGVMLDPANAVDSVKGNIALSAAPTIGGGNIPSSTIWWDGFTITTNQTDAQAETAFRVMMEGIDDQMIRANNDSAVWLSAAFVPSAASTGVFATASGGAPPYPMAPQMGYLHTALSDDIVDYLQGKESAEQALKDISSSYTSAAKEAGLL